MAKELWVFPVYVSSLIISQLIPVGHSSRFQNIKHVYYGLSTDCHEIGARIGRLRARIRLEYMACSLKPLALSKGVVSGEGGHT